MHCLEEHLLQSGIKILVSDCNDLKRIENILFEYGCGYHNGTHLKQDHSDCTHVISLFVSPKGVITLAFKSEEEYVEKHQNILIEL